MEWLAARCGLLTASEFCRILTPTLKIADNVKARAHLWEMAAQRISGHVEPTYQGDAMLRGHQDELLARDLYAKKYAPVQQVGFVVNDKWGFKLGCSPDGLVNDDGGIECKSRDQKYQVQTIVENYETGSIPDDYVLQVQGEMLVCERPWWDFISYSGGLPMAVIRVHADARIQDAILTAAAKFEARISEVIADYHRAVSENGFHPTERRIDQEMYI